MMTTLSIHSDILSFLASEVLEYLGFVMKLELNYSQTSDRGSRGGSHFLPTKITLAVFFRNRFLLPLYVARAIHFHGLLAS